MQRSQGWRLTRILIGILGSLSLTACGTSRPEPPPAVALQPASTPREAVVIAYTALSQGNEVALFAVCQTTPRQRDILSAHCKEVLACNEFRHAFIAAYGIAAWDDFGRKKTAKPDGKVVSSCQIDVIAEEELAVLKSEPIEEHGAEAFCLPPKKDYGEEAPKDEVARTSFEEPEKPTKIRMVQDASGWLVDGGSMTIDDRRIAPMFEGLTKVVKDTQKMIGQPGVTPEQISSALGKGMLKVIFVNIW